ncbi:GPI-anchored surface protein, putative, partial [Bodo saltans]
FVAHIACFVLLISAALSLTDNESTPVGDASCLLVNSCLRLRFYDHRLPPPPHSVRRPTVLFSAALNRLSDEMKVNFGRLVANVKAEMKDLRNRIKSDIQQRGSMNERIMYAYCVVGFFVLRCGVIVPT